jgi:hypothetical protein
LSVAVRSIRSTRFFHFISARLSGSRESDPRVRHAGINNLMVRIERTLTDTDGYGKSEFIRLCPFNPFDPFFIRLMPDRAAVSKIAAAFKDRRSE